MDLIRPTRAGDLPEVYAARLSDSKYRTVRWLSLSFTRAAGEEGDPLIETYRMHTLDLASHRVIPTLLAVTEGGCDHDACSMMNLNAYAADYAREVGWGMGHAAENALEIAGQLSLGLDLD